MSDLMDLFGDWALRADGTPHTITTTPAAGSSAWGAVDAAAVTLERPVMFGQRLIRTTDGQNVVSSVVVYVEADEAEHFTLAQPVVIDGTIDAHVIRLDRMSHQGMFDYAAVWCE